MTHFKAETFALVPCVLGHHGRSSIHDSVGGDLSMPKIIKDMSQEAAIRKQLAFLKRITCIL